MKVQRNGREFTVDVTADGEGVVSHAGAALLAETADRIGLTDSLSKGLFCASAVASTIPDGWYATSRRCSPPAAPTSPTCGPCATRSRSSGRRLRRHRLAHRGGDRSRPRAPGGAAHRPQAGARGREATELIDLSGWPEGSRLIVRRERPHPGAQLSFTDSDGHRFQAILTDRAGEAACLEREHRARCEDRIRCSKQMAISCAPALLAGAW